MAAEVLVLVEHAGGEPDELSLQALALARAYADGLGGAVSALLIGRGAAGAAGVLGVHGAALALVAEHEALEDDTRFAPDAWAASLCELIARRSPAAVVAAGSDRGNEVLARAAARLDQPMAANCLAAAAVGEGARVTRLRWGGSLLEEAELDGVPALLTVAPHAVATQRLDAAAAAVESFTPALREEDLRVAVRERVAAPGGGVSLADADVVVSGGRGVGSAEGFAAIEELAALLGGAVGCSRAVTMAGWRPHSDQVGQTGTKIAPELYIPCGISGATQHMAGCKGAKHLLAVNPDPEAPILASADYAVIGDLHEVVPAINAAIRKAREAR
ncbi:MAG TPA: electron transfer flavoprotein subunit alpha/FixB family protein [Solirubrobacteraceae bacterium]|nr:electron transfer flavoprotein subunit alpha/FixB family protein [Solirubrobacteraceae bacterium]